MTHKRTYADLIVNYLHQINIDYIFGVPGGAIEPLYDAVARHIRQPDDTQSLIHNSNIPIRNRSQKQPLKMIVARHEAGAAFMADGYARETGKLGVCCATTGPGTTNLITGVASAFTDRIPMLVITPQTALPNFGKLGLQESSSEVVDIVGMFEHCTHYNTFVSHHEQLEGKLYTALINAFRRPRGPVHLSIPMDILNMPVEGTFGNYQIAHHFRQPKFKDDSSYGLLKSKIESSKRIVFFVGGGCRGIAPHIQNLAERLNALIVSTPSGKKWVNAHHPLYRGVFGFAGHQSAYDTLCADDVELIVAIGTSLGELATSGWNKALLSDKLAHITNTLDDLTRSTMAGLHIMGDLPTIFEDLVSEIPERPSEQDYKTSHTGHPRKPYLPNSLMVMNGEKCYLDSSPLKPQRVMKELAERFPEKTRFLIDAGNAWAWATHYLLKRNNSYQRIGFGFGAMGWAIGAAVGTALGYIEADNAENSDADSVNHPDVVCITGDGSFLMSGQEITVAVEHELPVVFVVLNDEALGMVKHGQRLGGGEPIGYRLPPVDFASMARAMGANGIQITKPEDFQYLDIELMFRDNKPTLLDIHIDPEEVPPIGARLKTLRNKEL